MIRIRPRLKYHANKLHLFPGNRQILDNRLIQDNKQIVGHMKPKVIQDMKRKRKEHLLDNSETPRGQRIIGFKLPDSHLRLHSIISLLTTPNPLLMKRTDLSIKEQQTIFRSKKTVVV